MRTLFVILLVGVFFALCAPFQEPRAQEAVAEAVRFEAVDIYVDSGDRPLAAYQFELTAKKGKIAIVGIEGGDHPAFKEPPYYDPAALQNDRIIIAAFSTRPDLPKNRIRVARIHVEVTGEVEPEYVVTLTVAASAQGERIPATATVSRGAEE